MSHHEPGPGQQNMRGIRAIPLCSAKKRSPADSEIPPVYTPILVPFQLVADFEVEVPKAPEFLEEPDLSPQARSLFLAIINTPEALNRICDVAILCDRTEDSGDYSKGKLTELDREDILAQSFLTCPSNSRSIGLGCGDKTLTPSTSTLIAFFSNSKVH